LLSPQNGLAHVAPASASREKNSARPSFGVVLQDAVKRVAVFGNAGGGKSTLARQLAEITRLPLYVLDKLQFKERGAAVPHDEYLESHRDLLAQETWIIDGYGGNTTIWERFGAADTLIHVNLSLPIHYWRVTKRLIKGFFADPEGWPKDSPLWSSTMSSYEVIPRCHRHMTPRYRQLATEVAASKRVAHIRSPREMAAFLDDVGNEFTVG
jgi:adenylate kinase family enzyme